jgi:hypothetical protein
MLMFYGLQSLPFSKYKTMDENRRPKRSNEMVINGRGPRGRPWTRWLDQVKRDAEKRGRE